MNKTLADVPVAPNLTSKADWIEIEPLVFQRPCVGQEHSASYNQNAADGHTELSLSLQFSANMSTEEVVEKAKIGWSNCRFLHPEIAVELSTDFSIPQLMTYRILPDEQTQKAWMEETFVVEEGGSLEEMLEMTYNRRLTTRGKQSMMYLVLDTRPSLQDTQRNHGFIWNVSHAVTDAFSIIQFLNTFMQETVKGTNEAILSSGDFRPESIAKHLPISPLVSYQTLFKPSQEDKRKSLVEAKEQLSLYKDKLAESVAMYPEEDHDLREHSTHCLATEFSLSDSTKIVAALKAARVGITYVGAAATLLAAHQMYGKGHETGALLGMTRNARRWVATVIPASGRVAIPMATDVVFLWIPFDINAKSQTCTQRLLSLASEIKTQLNKHLLSPHYLASVPYMSEIFVESLRSSREAPLDMVTRSSPGFSSQGVLPLEKEYAAGEKRIVRTGFSHTGRQVGLSPWIGMFSLDSRLRFSVGFDSKYYRREPMEAFLDLVRENVASVADSSEQVTISKL